MLRVHKSNPQTDRHTPVTMITKLYRNHINILIYNIALLYADYKVILQKSEDQLQKSVYELERVCFKFGTRIYCNITKVIVF